MEMNVFSNQKEKEPHILRIGVVAHDFHLADCFIRAFRSESKRNSAESPIMSQMNIIQRRFLSPYTLGGSPMIRNDLIDCKDFAHILFSVYLLDRELITPDLDKYLRLQNSVCNAMIKDLDLDVFISCMRSRDLDNAPKIEAVDVPIVSCCYEQLKDKQSSKEGKVFAKLSFAGFANASCVAEIDKGPYFECVPETGFIEEFAPVCCKVLQQIIDKFSQ